MLRWIFSFSPITRATVLALLAYIGLEMFKPSFAFYESNDGGYISKPFGSGETINQDDEVIPQTKLTWWAVVLGIFAFFALFV